MTETTETKFTPGPWGVGEPDDNAQPTVTAANGLEVATCWHHCVESIEREAHANARLIAKAPELYALLNRAADMIASAERASDRPSSYALEFVRECRTALRKARGEPQ